MNTDCCENCVIRCRCPKPSNHGHVDKCANSSCSCHAPTKGGEKGTCVECGHENCKVCENCHNLNYCSNSRFLPIKACFDQLSPQEPLNEKKCGLGCVLTEPHEGYCKPPSHKQSEPSRDKRTKIEAGAKDFAERFAPVMKELAEEEKICGCDAHKLDDDRNHDFADCPLHKESESEWESFLDLGGEFVDFEGDIRPGGRVKLIAFIARLLEEKDKKAYDLANENATFGFKEGHKEAERLAKDGHAIGLKEGARMERERLIKLAEKEKMLDVGYMSPNSHRGHYERGYNSALDAFIQLASKNI